MDLFIETLTGTAFELRVSPFETIMSVKAKIQRLEGIPISQQHLIWRSTELEDDYCLHDYNITDGTTLQLVLAMRGGPINTRRIPMEDPTLREMAEYMEANRDEIWDKLPKDNRQVTLLVFRDGDQLNFFRVVDRGDGTLTPLSDSLSGASMYNLYDEEEDDQTAPISQEAIKENTVTMNKMQLLQKRMEDVQAQKKSKFQPRPPSGDKPSRSVIPNARRRLHLSNGTSNSHKNSSQKENLKCEKEKVIGTSNVTATVGNTSKGPLPPVNVRKNDHIDISDFIQNLEPSKQTRDTKVNFKQSISRSGRKSITTDLMDDNNVARVSHKNSGKKEYDKDSNIHYRSRREKDTPSVARDYDESLGSASLRQSIPSHIRGSAGLRHTYTLESRIGGITEAAESATIRRLSTPERQRSGLLNDSLTRSHKISINPLGSQTVTPPSHLPPVKAKPPPLLVPAKKKNRCFSCGKKTGLATTYQCRCGNSFCATHRYAETHKCNYDYKSEGRKLIEQNNPVVTAPKLPKI